MGYVLLALLLGVAAGLGVGLGIGLGRKNTSSSSSTERLVDGIKTNNLMTHLRVSCYVTGGFKRYTVEPPNKGHFGANSFVYFREVVPISEVSIVLAWCCNKCPL